MNDQNHATLASYEAKADAYVAGTPHAMSDDVAGWLARATEGLAPDAAIPEIGSAFGREADVCAGPLLLKARSISSREIISFALDRITVTISKGSLKGPPLITLSNEKSKFSVILTGQENAYSLNGTLPELCALLQTAREHWVKLSPKEREQLLYAD